MGGAGPVLPALPLALESTGQPAGTLWESQEIIELAVLLFTEDQEILSDRVSVVVLTEEHDVLAEYPAFEEHQEILPASLPNLRTGLPASGAGRRIWPVGSGSVS